MFLGMLRAWLSLLRALCPMMAYSQIIVGAAIAGEQLTPDLNAR
jgi:hypothetical protein